MIYLFFKKLKTAEDVSRLLFFISSRKIILRNTRYIDLYEMSFFQGVAVDSVIQQNEKALKIILFSELFWR